MATTKKIRTTKILAALYKAEFRSKITTKDQFLVGMDKTVGVQFNSREERAYTTLVGKSRDKLFIVIGGQMISKIAELPETFSDKKTFYPYYSAIEKSFYGLNYHEMGHVLFTDMKDRSIVDYKEPKYVGFLHTLFNILEDQVIEINMSNLFYIDPALEWDTNPKVYFNFIIEKLFKPQCDAYKDDGTQKGFVDYLLLSLRCGKAALKSKCAIFEKYHENLVPLVKDVLFERNPTKRIHKTITLGEWIIENIKEFDWTLPEPPEKLSGKFSGDPTSEPGAGSPIPSPMESPEDEKGSSKKKEDPFGEEEDETSSSVDDDSKDDADETDTCDDEEKEMPSLSDSVEDEIDDVFNDVIHDGDDHEWVIAKDEYEVVDPIIFDEINNKIDSFSDSINDVSKFLTLFKGRRKPRKLPGCPRGSLDIRAAMQDDLRDGCNTKIFMQNIARGKDKDLAVSLLCDNSGSMSGTKSFIASNAALVLAQACEWSKIPFECNAFTKTEDSIRGTCITIKIKSLEDSFEKAKPYFAINDSSLIGGLKSFRYIPTFYGNSEEVNLYYIAQEFARVNHKTKLLFVLCDGATTGSRSDLKNIVRQIENEQHIIVIGIGVCCKEVADIYPHHKLFNSTSELKEGLAQYLVDTLSKYAS